MVKISKSRYTSFVTCPKQFWLNYYKPELKGAPDAGLQYRFEQGTEVGEIALKLFAGVENATVRKPDGSLDIGAMCEKTKRLVSENCTAIAEAAFSGKDFYCAVDILKNTGGAWDIYEVKSSTKPKDIYYTDIAFQRYALTESGVKIRNCYLAYINHEYVRSGEINPFGLFTVEDVTPLLNNFYKNIPENLAQAQAVHDSEIEPPIDINHNCHSPYLCVFYNYCSRHLPKPSVFDLYNYRKKIECYQKGIVSFEDIRQANIPLNEKQQRQLDFELDNKPPYIDTTGIHAFLNTIKFPAYFLDFETYQTCLPLYDGMKPYQQIPFQYSLHILKNKGDEKPEHKEFLANENKNEWRTLAQQLVTDIPSDEGSVIVFNANFERTRNKEMATAFPDLAERLLNINTRIVDLLDVFRHGYMYKKEMGGSFSIKRILPALCPDNSELDYKANEDVQNGTAATLAFLSLKNQPPTDRERIRKSLLKYCGLDTLAMVEIYWELGRIVG